MKRKIFITMIAIFAMFSSSVQSRVVAESANPADTTLRDDFINDIRLTKDKEGTEAISGTVSKGDIFYVHIDFSLKDKWEDHQPLGGKVISFPMPEGLDLPEGSALAGKQMLQCTDEAGSIDCMEYQVIDGILYLTLNDELNKRSEIKGTLFFGIALNDEILGPWDNVIKHPFKDENLAEFDIVDPDKEDKATVEKTGVISATDGNVIDWTIKVNQNSEKMTDAKLIDTLPPFLTYISGSMSAEKYTYNLLGEIINRESVTLTPNVVGQDITVPLGDIQDVYEIKFSTQIDHTHEDVKDIYFKGGNLEITNSATLEHKKDDVIVEEKDDATVNKPFEKLLNKTGSYEMTSEGRFLNYTVTFNASKHTLTNPLLIDKYDSNFEFVAGSLEMSGTEVDSTVTYNEANSSFSVKFNGELKDTVTMTYRLKVKDDVTHLNVDKVNNSISYYNNGNQGGTGGGPGVPDVTEGIGVGVSSGIISKHATSVDYNNKVISWKSVINEGRQEMSNVSLLDTFGPGLTLDVTSIIIKNTDKSNQTLVLGTDYTLDHVNGSSTFKVTFIGTYAKFKDQLTLEYKTGYDVRPMELTTEGKANKKAVNKNALTWTDLNNKTHTDPAEAIVDFDKQPVLSNNLKRGSYDRDSKEITWQVFLNYNNYQDLNQLRFKDIIDGSKHKYVDGSIVLYEYAVDPSTGAVTKGQKIASVDDQGNVTTTNDPVTSVISLDLDAYKKQRVLVEFKVTLEEYIILKEYTNVASITDVSNTPTDVTGTVKVPEGGKYIDKGKHYDPLKDPMLLSWSLNINASQSTLSDVKVLDQPSAGQIVLKNTIKLYKANLSVNGDKVSLSKLGSPLVLDTDYTVTHSTSEAGLPQFEVAFKAAKITEPYILEYDVLLDPANAPANGVITNVASISGDKELPAGGSENNSNHSITESGGSIVSKQGELTFKKIDKSTGKPMANVEFEIFLKRTMTSFGKATTNENGIVKFSKLPYTTYVLRETRPAYYAESDLTKTGIDVVLNASTSSIENPAYVQQLSNTPFEINISKTLTGGASTTMSDVTLTLEKMKSSTSDEVDPTFTPIVLERANNGNGKYRFAQIEAGSYRIRETAVPNGSPRFTGDIRVEITDQSPSISKTLTNHKGSIEIKKVNSLKEVLPGAEFVLKKDGVTIATETTNAKGILSFKDLGPGTYTITETRAPQGYLNPKNPETHTLVVPEMFTDNTTTKKFELKKEVTNDRPSIRVRKTDSEKNPLKGAIFSLYKNDILVKTATSNDLGIATFDHVDVDQTAVYTVKETTAPAGYIRNTRVLTVPTITADGPTLYDLGDVMNYKGSVILEKKAFGLTTMLPGAEFTLTDKAGNQQTVVLENGRLQIDDLAPGTYTLTETKAPSGYMLPTQDFTFVIADAAENKPSINTEIIYNHKTTVRVRKQNDLGNPIQGGRFELRQGSTVVQSATANADGWIEFTNIAAGDYTMVEVEAPAGYVINTTPLDISFTQNGLKGNDARFTLVDGVPTLTIQDPFVNYKGRVEITKVDGDLSTRKLAGASFKLYKVDQGRVEITGADVFTTDTLGKLVITNLAVGRYEIVETEAPVGYLLDSTPIPFEVVESAEGEPSLIVKQIENVKASIEFVKENDEGERLPGAVFELVDANDAVVQTQTSNADGVVLFEHVAVGTYTIRETQAPAGYILNEEVIEVTVAKTDIKTTHTLKTPFVNYRGSLQITKTDEYDDPLIGAIFRIEKDGVFVTNVTTDKDGIATLPELAPGQYSVKEIVAPTGYRLDSVARTFEVSAENNGVLPRKNIVLVNTLTDVIFTKTDEQEVGLPGAEFGLFQDDVQIYTATSDEHGDVRFVDVATGTYQLKETKAPEDFVRNTKVVDVEIVDTGAREVVLDPELFVNYKGSATITKVNKDNEVLEGAEFELYFEDALLQSGLVTDAAGRIELTDLAPGTYVLKEVKAPEGYIIDVDAQETEFTIVDEALEIPLTTEHTVVNTKAVLEFTKVDRFGTPLAGVTFELKGNGTTYTSISDELGIVRFEDLAPGAYTLQETGAKKGFVLDTTVHHVVIEALTTPVIQIEDLVNYQGSLLIRKTDGKSLLKEATFNIVGEGVSTTLKTVKGELLLEDLAPGVYTIREVEAPKGYVLSTEVFTVEIAAAASGQPEAFQLEVVNQKNPELPNTGVGSNHVGLGVSLLGLVLLFKRKKQD